MIGIPGSGKTTYVRETLPKHSHISLDINRKSISTDREAHTVRKIRQ